MRLYALLAGDPFWIPFERIARLTDRQKYDVLLHEIRRRRGGGGGGEDGPAGGKAPPSLTYLSDKEGSREIDEEAGLWKLAEAGFLKTEDVLRVIREKQEYYARQAAGAGDPPPVMGGDR